MLKDYKITITIRVLEGSEEHVLPSIQDGMGLDTDIGEGVLHYDVQEVEIACEHPDLSTTPN